MSAPPVSAQKPPTGLSLVRSAGRLGTSLLIEAEPADRDERGDNNVAMLTLSRIAKALGLSISALLTEAGLRGNRTRENGFDRLVV